MVTRVRVPGITVVAADRRGMGIHAVYSNVHGLVKKRYAVMYTYKTGQYLVEEINLLGRFKPIAKQPQELWKNVWEFRQEATSALITYERNRYGNRKIVRLWNFLRRR